jgi:hypothetical protein
MQWSTTWSKRRTVTDGDFPRKPKTLINLCSESLNCLPAKSAELSRTAPKGGDFLAAEHREGAHRGARARDGCTANRGSQQDVRDRRSNALSKFRARSSLVRPTPFRYSMSHVLLIASRCFPRPNC